MSQIKLTLRPPPNVDFVHGYPGIPPGAPDRPQAAVKGAIEVRVSPQGVKAKWVRVELRKVETLPGGGPANTYYDFVGPSPVNLWQSSEDYTMLHTQDFHFNIRIPEAIPPSIALENRAGIKYELVATVCTLGKRGFFFRKRKSTVVNTMAPIIIDKHELHSTWPVYCQPESRQLSQEGVNLMVERTHTCYGPGDRVSVMATLKSDSLHTVIFRGFELFLKESIVFRPGHITGKKSAPQVKVSYIGEHKFPVNVTLYGGDHHKAELACEISPKHTTTSLNAARHIDITYTLSVKALMGTGTHLIMDLPVILSNWPRNVSIEAIRRIGLAPSLSLMPTHQQYGTPPPAQRSYPTNMVTSRPNQPMPSPSKLDAPITDYGFNRSQSAIAYNTAPSKLANGYTPAAPPDEFGYGQGYGKTGAATFDNAAFVNSAPSPAVNTARLANGLTESLSTGVRPQRSAAPSANRLTVTNLVEEPDRPRDDSSSRPAYTALPSNGNANGSPSRPAWPTAEDEKKRLYDKAVAEAQRVQQRAEVSSANQTESLTQRVPHKDAGQLVAPAPYSPPSRSTPWPTAEEEKLRLFEQAQAAARRTQANGYSAEPMLGRNNSGYNASGSGSSAPPAASSYTLSAQRNGRTQADRAVPKNSSPQPKPSVPHYPTAEEEKAALRRYHEAKLAVDRTQNSAFGSSDESYGQGSSSSSNPVPYNAAVAAPSRSYTSASPPPIDNDLPPPFDFPAEQPPSHLTEKERLRRAYETLDTAAAAKPPTPPVNGIPAYTPSRASPPLAYTPNGNSTSDSSAVSEKERLRKKFEAQDAMAAANGTPGTPPQPPPRSLRGNGRAQPVPPSSASGSGGSKILTAAEEKALLRARYEAEERGDSAGAGSSFDSGSIPAPPPLLPKPPVHYIQETQEEDARVSRLVTHDGPMPADDDPSSLYTPDMNGLRRFSTYTYGYESGGSKSTVTPPPLPPKLPIT